MNLLSDPWITAERNDASTALIAPWQIGDPQWVNIVAPRPDFRGALYQFLLGVLQTLVAPSDSTSWADAYAEPPSADALKAAFEPYFDAFKLENTGPTFMQDFALPAEVNQLPVLDLLIDAGSSSNLYFNKPIADHGLCEACFAQALFTLQINAPSGGRGIRTSLRGGGPLTTLLMPAEQDATLWQKLWLNVLPQDALNHSDVLNLSDVWPWLAPTRTSDDKGGKDTPPETVHPLQAYWSMPRRIRIDRSTIEEGCCCAVCGAANVRVIRHYLTRHGGTNYTGAWVHPLTPYSLDAKGEKPPISAKGHQAGRGYRDWLGLVLGNEDHQPDPARVVSQFNMRSNTAHIKIKLWCFGYSMSNMKALCWYDSSLPIHQIDKDVLRPFSRSVKQVLDSAEGMATQLHKQVKAAWFKRPGDVKPEPAVLQSFWQGSEPVFYRTLEALAKLDFERNAELTPVYQQWLLETREQVLRLFDVWVLSGSVEDLDMQRVVKARVDLIKALHSDKAIKPLWELVNHQKSKKTSQSKKKEAV